MTAPTTMTPGYRRRRPLLVVRDRSGRPDVFVFSPNADVAALITAGTYRDLDAHPTIHQTGGWVITRADLPDLLALADVSGWTVRLPRGRGDGA